MFDYESTKDFKIRSTTRFNKPVSPFPRTPGNFIRRPFPAFRNRMMSRRYPNTGFRPFVRPVFRPEFPPPRGMPHDYRYPPPLNPTVSVTPQSVERPEHPNFAISNSCNNRNIHYPIAPKPMVNDYGNQNIMESPNSRSIHLADLNLSELWIEAVAPNRQLYYYNARTRETKWEKPPNVRIIALDEIKRLTSKPEMGQIQNLPKENQNSFAKATPGTCISPYVPGPRNFVMPQRFLFPPPPNVCPPPQIICTPPPIEPFQNTPICRFNVMVPPPIFPLPLITENTVPKIEVDSNNDTNVAMTKNALEISNTLEKYIINEDYNSSESKISDWSISESKISLCTFGNTNDEKNPSVERKEDTAQMDLDKSADCEAVNSDSFDSEDESKSSVTTPLLIESKVFCSKETTEKSEEKIVDKSRPVSSTPVPGTCWSVVWTGDEKVFFYNSQRKISVWDRPDELLNRLDVDRLIEKPLLQPQDLKSSTSSCGPSTTSSNSNAPTFDSDSSQSCFDTSVISSDLSTTSATGIPSAKKSHESNATFCAKKLKTDDETEEKALEFNQDTDCTANADTENEKEQSAPEEISHELRVQIFREMLVEKKVSALSTWEKELHKIVFDSRYLLLPSKERKQIFDSYMQEKLEEEKNDRYKELQNQRKRFRALLEESGLTSKSRFSDFAQRYGKDVRFKTIEKIKQKENMFNQYISELIKKEKALEKHQLKQKRNFIELLSEQKTLNKDSSWPEIEKIILNDERYKSIENKTLREKLFQEYINERQSNINTSSSNNSGDPDPATTSIRNREEQVKRDLSIPLKEREREQELHKHKSAVSNFKALLNDLIKNSDISWHSAKKYLKADHRWDFTQHLETDERENLFNLHIDSLTSKKKEQFYQLLDEIPDISLKTSWLDIRKFVLRDLRCTKFSSSERKCEKEFKDYLRKKILTAKYDFRQLLKETKIITHKSKSLLKKSNHLKDIENALSKDKRYLILECMRNERREILLHYIDNLHTRGPPPPPTASEPSNRN